MTEGVVDGLRAKSEEGGSSLLTSGGKRQILKTEC